MKQELILHHYTNSPFAAKVRVAMGIKQLEWKSLSVPMINKNRITTEITGGYRRIPVLQVGRDFYCDSTLILRYLNTCSSSSSNNNEQDLELALMLGAHFDKSVFPAVVAQLFSSSDGANILEGTGVTLEEMMMDRAQMMQGSAMASGAAGGTRKDQLYSYLAQVEDLLDGEREFLLPGSTPTFADACAFAQFDRIVQRDIFHDFPKLTQWLERVRAIGEGNSEQCTEKYAIEAINSAAATRQRTPPNTEHNSKLKLGSMVTLKPEDYGNFEITGKLVEVDKHSIVLERPLADTNVNVRLHFPRLGYKVSSSQSKL